MKGLKFLLCAATLAAGLMVTVQAAQAYHHGRSYYSSWNYYPQRHYYYSTYYYHPTTEYTDDTSYDYHYCVYVPQHPHYCYYYNPVRHCYWGRYDLEAKGYSLLDKKDQKEDLNAIPESAFPKPGEMPPIPGATDGAKLEAPPAPPTVAANK